MPGEIDPRLVGLLKASLGLADVLRDMGAGGALDLRLDREGGLALLDLVAGERSAEAEAFSQRNRRNSEGLNSLAVGGLTFRWPQRSIVAKAANDNASAPTAALAFGFEEETPALR